MIWLILTFFHVIKGSSDSDDCDSFDDATSVIDFDSADEEVKSDDESEYRNGPDSEWSKG